METMIAALIMLGTLRPYSIDIVRFEDKEKEVTCWVTIPPVGATTFCIPNKELKNDIKNR